MKAAKSPTKKLSTTKVTAISKVSPKKKLPPTSKRPAEAQYESKLSAADSRLEEHSATVSDLHTTQLIRTKSKETGVKRVDTQKSFQDFSFQQTQIDRLNEQISELKDNNSYLNGQLADEKMNVNQLERDKFKAESQLELKSQQVTQYQEMNKIFEAQIRDFQQKTENMMKLEFEMKRMQMEKDMSDKASQENEEKLIKLMTQVDQQKELIQKLEDQLRSETSNMKFERERYKQLEQQLENQNQKLQDSKELTQNCRNEVELLTKQLKEFESNNNKLKFEQEQSQLVQKNLESYNQKLEQERNTIESSITQIKQQYKETLTRQFQQKFNDKVEVLEQQKEELKQQLSTQQQKASKLVKGYTDKIQQLEYKLSRIENLENQHNELIVQKSDLQQEFHKSQQIIQQKEKIIQQFLTKLEQNCDNAEIQAKYHTISELYQLTKQKLVKTEQLADSRLLNVTQQVQGSIHELTLRNEKLEQQLVDLNIQLNQQTEKVELDNIRLAETESTIYDYQQKLKQLQIEAQKYQVNSDKNQNLVVSLQDQLTLVSKEKEDFEKMALDLGQKVAIYNLQNVQMPQNNNQIAEFQKIYSNYQEQIRRQSEQIQDLNRKLLDLQNQYSILQNKTNGITQAKEELQQILETGENQVSKTQSNNEELSKRVNSLEEKNRQLQQQLQRAKEQLADFLDRADATAGDIDDEGTHSDNMNLLLQYQQKCQNLTKTNYQLEQQVNDQANQIGILQTYTAQLEQQKQELVAKSNQLTLEVQNHMNSFAQIPSAEQYLPMFELASRRQTGNSLGPNVEQNVQNSIIEQLQNTITNNEQSKLAQTQVMNSQAQQIQQLEQQNQQQLQTIRMLQQSNLEAQSLDLAPKERVIIQEKLIPAAVTQLDITNSSPYQMLQTEHNQLLAKFNDAVSKNEKMSSQIGDLQQQYTQILLNTSQQKQGFDQDQQQVLLNQLSQEREMYQQNIIRITSDYEQRLADQTLIITQKEQQIVAKDQEIDNFQSQLQSLAIRTSEYQVMNTNYEDNLKSCETENLRLKEICLKFKQNRQSMLETIEQNKSENDKLQQQIDCKNQEMQRFQAQMQMIDEVMAESNTLKLQLQQVQSECQILKDENSALSVQRQQALSENETLQQFLNDKVGLEMQISDIRNQLIQVRQDKQFINEQLLEERDKLSEMQRNANIQQNTISTYESKLQQVNELQFNKLQHDNAALRAQIDVLNAKYTQEEVKNVQFQQLYNTQLESLTTLQNSNMKLQFIHKDALQKQVQFSFLAYNHLLILKQLSNLGNLHSWRVSKPELLTLIQGKFVADQQLKQFVVDFLKKDLTNEDSGKVNLLSQTGFREAGFYTRSELRNLGDSMRLLVTRNTNCFADLQQAYDYHLQIAQLAALFCHCPNVHAKLAALLNLPHDFNKDKKLMNLDIDQVYSENIQEIQKTSSQLLYSPYVSDYIFQALYAKGVRAALANNYNDESEAELIKMVTALYELVLIDKPSCFPRVKKLDLQRTGTLQTTKIYRAEELSYTFDYTLAYLIFSVFATISGFQIDFHISEVTDGKPISALNVAGGEVCDGDPSVSYSLFYPGWHRVGDEQDYLVKPKGRALK